MKIFYANDADSKQFEVIQFWMKKYMDGSVSSKMEQNGIHYLVNHGVSIVHLRKYSTQLECSQQLIRRLWLSEIREGMILATLLFDESILLTEPTFVSDRINNIEVAEQFAFNLGYKVPNLASYYTAWLPSENEYIQISALLSVAIALQKHQPLNLDALTVFWNQSIVVELKSLSLERAFTRFLVGLLSLKEMRVQITELAKRWVDTGSLAQIRVANEVLIELSYCDN